MCPGCNGARASPVELSEHPPYGKKTRDSRRSKLGRPMDRRACPQIGSEQALGNLRESSLPWGRLGWLVRTNVDPPLKGQVDRGGGPAKGPGLYQYAIQLWNAGRVAWWSAPYSKRGNCQGVSFRMVKLSQVLRRDVFGLKPLNAREIRLLTICPDLLLTSKQTPLAPADLVIGSLGGPPASSLRPS